MTHEHALEIIRKLGSGTHPITGDPLPGDSTYHEPEIVRALFTAAAVLEKSAVRERRQAALPENSGKSWSPEEDQRLAASFSQGISAKLLAAEHRRTLTAIHARLVKLGHVREGDWLDGVQVQRPRLDQKP